MRHGSLFSGIGGFDLAAQWMGWDNIFQVEYDEWCQKILTKNFPNVKKYRDIKEFNGTKYRGAVDIISGGFPCQPFSHAGKRQGEADDRYLWPEMLRVIREVKPAFVVGENVAGLVSMENGKTLEGIFSDLENEGYQTESFIIPACGVGAWHRRDRIWILAYTSNYSDRTNGGEEREANGLQGKRGEEGCSRMPCGTGKDAPNSNNSGIRTPRSGIDGNEQENIKGRERESQPEPCGCSKDVSNSNDQGLEGWQESGNIRGGREKRNEQPERYGESFGGEYWATEPNVGRVAHGIPNRVDRLKELGNAIVPQVAYEIFKVIEIKFVQSE